MRGVLRYQSWPQSGSAGASFRRARKPLLEDHPPRWFTREEIAPENDELVLAYRCGLTTAVERPTSRADELSRDEFERAASGLSEKIARYSPKYVAFLGKPAFSAIFGRKLVSWGKQDALLGGSRTWVLPNPSGLNRSFRLDQLVRAYTELRIALDGVSK